MSTEATPLTAEEEARLRRSISITGKASHCDCVLRLLATLTRERAEHAALRVPEDARLSIAGAISDIEANRPVRQGHRFRVMEFLRAALDEVKE